jgi:tRNA G18 (ribose-2'-O)-methylase SpoU
MDEDRIPFQVTVGAVVYENIDRLPVTVLLDNVRSAYNVGSFFRSADAAKIERIVLCGITSCPPHKGVVKTALGAEGTVPWEFVNDSEVAVQTLREQGHGMWRLPAELRCLSCLGSTEK